MLFALLSASVNSEPGELTREQRNSVEVITPEQIDYVPLNPARGDSSPQAGVLWGDIRKDVPSGVLLRFAEGFSSPPHIHNITYRAVVIDGEIHNDDPGAARLWMGPGAFWVQPAGEVHITATRRGKAGTAFLEILEGPYLVEPGSAAFDNGERPVNLVSSQLVWLSGDELTWIETHGDGAPGVEAAFLWGKVQSGSLHGSFVKLPAGHAGGIASIDGDLKVVIVSGELSHAVEDPSVVVSLGPGGYFASAEQVRHSLTCSDQGECTVYVRTDGKLEID